MNSLKASLRKLIGRIRKHMEAVWLGLGTIFLTIGLSLFVTVQSDAQKYVGLFLSFLGIIFYAISYQITKTKMDDDRQRVNLDSENFIRTSEALRTAVEELRKMNENTANILAEMRKNKNGQQSTNSTNNPDK